MTRIWTSSEKKSRKRFHCAYCNKWRSAGWIYRWVDGGKSCDDCNYPPTIEMPPPNQSCNPDTMPIGEDGTQ